MFYYFWHKSPVLSLLAQVDPTLLPPPEPTLSPKETLEALSSALADQMAPLSDLNLIGVRVLTTKGATKLTFHSQEDGLKACSSGLCIRQTGQCLRPREFHSDHEDRVRFCTICCNIGHGPSLCPQAQTPVRHMCTTRAQR